MTLPFEEKPKSNLPGDNLKYYRQRKSLTTRQLAEKMDVVPATILMYEQNKHPIPYDVANDLASMLEVNAEVLYDDFAVFLAPPYSEALKDIRMAVEMSQKAFAEHIGVIQVITINSNQGIVDRPERYIREWLILWLIPIHFIPFLRSISYNQSENR
mgnify:FL=1